MAEARIDPLSEAERSARMARVRGAGNKSTEGRVEAALIAAVFVDGCFWHGCPACARRTPTARAEFWRSKIDENWRRNGRQRRRLRRQGYHVMRVWEHDIKKGPWLTRLRAMLARDEPREA